MTDVVYRDANLDDCEAIGVFLSAAFADTFAHNYRPEDLAAFLAATFTPAEQYAELIDPSRDTRLAFAGEQLVGVAQIGPRKLPYDENGAWELHRLYIGRDFQGAGVANLLMEWAFETARSRFATSMLLSVWSENIRAQRFYARRGFEKVGHYRFVVGDAVDDDWILRSAL